MEEDEEIEAVILARTVQVGTPEMTIEFEPRGVRMANEMNQWYAQVVIEGAVLRAPDVSIVRGAQVLKRVRVVAIKDRQLHQLRGLQDQSDHLQKTCVV